VPCSWVWVNVVGLCTQNAGNVTYIAFLEGEKTRLANDVEACARK
jgi:hypothetical protein